MVRLRLSHYPRGVEGLQGVLHMGPGPTEGNRYFPFDLREISLERPVLGALTEVWGKVVVMSVEPWIESCFLYIPF